METNYALLFYLKKPKGWTMGSIPIYMQDHCQCPGKEVSTGCKCEPERWCCKSNRESGTKESTRLLNTYLDELDKKSKKPTRSSLRNERNHLRQP